MAERGAIRELDIVDRSTAAAVLACQRAGYAVEAELISFDGIPPLRESLDELRQCGERFFGSFDEAGLAGVVSWRRLADGTVDICRLVVAPRAFRMGHATALLDALDLAEPAERFTVSTGTANIPALTLYRRHGFTPVGTREVAPGVTVTLLERRQRPDRQDTASAEKNSATDLSSQVSNGQSRRSLLTAVFVHGVPETTRVWMELRDRLGGTSVALTLPGFASPL